MHGVLLQLLRRGAKLPVPAWPGHHTHQASTTREAETIERERGLGEQRTLFQPMGVEEAAAAAEGLEAAVPAEGLEVPAEVAEAVHNAAKTIEMEATVEDTTTEICLFEAHPLELSAPTGINLRSACSEFWRSFFSEM